MKFQAAFGAIFVTLLFSVHETSAQTTFPEVCNATSCGSNGKCLYHQCTLGIGCACNAGYRETIITADYRTCVIANKKVDEICSTSAACMGVNTKCTPLNATHNVCKCTDEYTPTSDGTDCIAAELGASCKTIACSIYAECVNDVCVCKPGYKASGDGTNCTHLLPGDACRSTTECQKENCHGGTCKTGYYECLNGLKWYINLYTPTATNNIVLKNGLCVPARSITDIGGGHYCGTSESKKYFYCSSGYSCDFCPEDAFNTERRICIGSGALMTSFSYIGVICALLLSIYFH